ncbi:MAG TPA: toll/interleukin-1 receptor domain-containing protein [Candidatus Bathyarchaeia archaeon]|nr:toll/interleukin-1 receptor domain-containing protein [Candidatus Bathyarchaeia archaeon]
MADIVISYKREEQETARALADALRASGWTVWWDPKLRAGEHFDDAIEQAIRDAKCVIVLWSRLSTKSEYVRDEANFAKELGKLVPVAINRAELPMRFRGLHTLQMQDWDGSREADGFRSLVEQLHSKIGAGALAAAEGATPAGSGAGASSAGSEKQPIVWDTQYDWSSGLASARLFSKVVTPEQCGLDERSLLNLHADLERQRERDRKILLERYSTPDNSPNYGFLTSIDLILVAGDKVLKRRANEVLEKMKAAGGEAIDYTPEQLKKLPDKLKARGFALLLNMFEHVSNEPGKLGITQQTIDWYASMHGSKLPPGIRDSLGFPAIPSEEIEEVRELARRLGLEAKGL